MKSENTQTTTFNPHEIAQYFLSFGESTGDLLTNLKVQKLIYYVQAWNLAVNKESLFDDDFEAWVHGPVIRSLYDSFKSFGSKPIILELGENYCEEFYARLNDKTKVIFDDVIEVYFPETAYKLEQMTHNELPWQKARDGLPPYEPSNNIIQKQWMLDYYSSKIQ